MRGRVGPVRLRLIRAWSWASGPVGRRRFRRPAKTPRRTSSSCRLCGPLPRLQALHLQGGDRSSCAKRGDYGSSFKPRCLDWARRPGSSIEDGSRSPMAAHPTAVDRRVAQHHRVRLCRFGGTPHTLVGWAHRASIGARDLGAREPGARDPGAREPGAREPGAPGSRSLRARSPRPLIVANPGPRAHV